MKKFQFQLDTVLRYKTQILDIRLAEHGTALAAVRRQEALLEQATNNRLACEEEYRQRKAEGLTIVEAMKYETGIEVLEATVRREAAKLKELQKAEEQKRAALVEAKQETQSLETANTPPPWTKSRSSRPSSPQSTASCAKRMNFSTRSATSWPRS